MAPPVHPIDAPGGYESSSEGQSADTCDRTGTMNPRLRRILLVLCLLIAAGIRCSLFLESRSGPDYAHPLHDAEFRDYWARAIVTGDWTPPPGREQPFADWLPYPHAPGYSWLLSGIYRIFGLGYDAPRLIQMFLGLISILLLYDIARRLYNDKAGIAAAALMSLYFVFPFYEMDLGQTSLIVFLLLLLTLFGSKAVKKQHLLFLTINALLFGILLLVRNEFLPFGIIFLGVHLFSYLKSKNWKKILAGTTLWCLFSIIPVTPVSVYNYQHAQVLPIVGGEGTYVFYCSNNQWATGTNPDSPDLRALEKNDEWTFFSFPAIQEACARAQNITPLSYRELQKHFKQLNRKYIATEKKRLFWLMLKKAALFWGPVEVDENKVVACEKDYFAVLRYLPGFPPAMALFLLGAVLLFIRAIRKEKNCTKENLAAWTLLLLAMAGYSGIFVLFYVTARYRVPVIPFMLLFGAVAVSDWFEWLRRKAFKKAAVGLTAFLLLTALLSRPLVPFTPDTERWLDERRRLWVKTDRIDEGIADQEAWNIRHPQSPGGQYHLALLLIEKGDYEKALNCLQRTIALDSGYNAAYYNQGIVLLKLNRPEEALESFRIRLDRVPNDEKAWFGLAQAQQMLGDTGLQREALDHALSLKPGYPEALVDRSTLFLQEGNRDRAQALLEKALEAAPGYAMAEFNLGLLLAGEGSYSKALSFFESALTHAPDRADFHYNTGLALIQLKQYEEAVRHFHEALRLRPDYPEVYSNLGLSEARRHHEEEAKHAFDRAFELLPEDSDTLYNYGCSLNSLGDTAGARRYFEAVLEQAPDHGKALFELALLDIKEKALDNALIRLNRARTILSGDPEVCYNLGLIRQQQYASDEAQRLFLETLQLDPGHFGANRSLGTLLRSEGRSADALPYLKAALEASEAADDSALHYEYGVALYDLRHFDEAGQALNEAAQLAPGSAAIRTHQALVSIARHNFGDAVAHFREAVALDPDNLLLRYRLGLAELEEGDAASAADTLAPLLKQLPHRKDLFCDYGRALAALSKHDEALQAYRVAWLLDPAYLIAINALAFSLSMSGRPAEALEWLDLALAQDPENQDALFNTGHALHLLGNLEAADRLFLALLRLNPHHSTALLNRGLILEMQQRPEEAQAQFEAALKENNGLALAHHHLAGLLRRKGDREQALRHYRQARELDPGNQSTAVNLGFTLVELGRLAEAKELFLQAQEQAPDDAEAYIGQGDVLLAENNLNEAEAAYRHALRLSPDNAVALKQYGFLLVRQGKSAEALEKFEAARAALPYDAGLYCGLGDVSFARGELERAESYYQKAVELYPDFALAWNNYGDLLARKGQTQEAISAYLRARALEPENTSVLLNLGRLYAREKEAAPAVEVLETALRLEPDNLRVRALLGDMRMLTGDAPSAIREYQRILLERPDWQEIRDKLDTARAQAAEN